MDERSNRRKILAATSQLKQLRKESLKKFTLERDSTHDLCDAGAVLYQLSYQANWDQLGAGHIVSSKRIREG